MLSCKDVTRLISDSMERDLPFGKRVGMRLHILICGFCARYERQLHLIRDTVRRICDPDGAPGGGNDFGLGEDARNRIRKAMTLP